MIKINASDFKAQCLAILDSVNETGERVVILKRGKPVAQLTCYTGDGEGSPQAKLKGTAVVVGDIIEPAIPEDHWDVMN